jgi:hypothetical protein
MIMISPGLDVDISELIVNLVNGRSTYRPGADRQPIGCPATLKLERHQASPSHPRVAWATHLLVIGSGFGLRIARIGRANDSQHRKDCK